MFIIRDKYDKMVYMDLMVIAIGAI